MPWRRRCSIPPSSCPRPASRSTSGPSGCVEEITSATQRMPISCEATTAGVGWDASSVPAGAYSVWGYTYEPVQSLWTPRDGVLRIIDGDEASAGPAASIAWPLTQATAGLDEGRALAARCLRGGLGLACGARGRARRRRLRPGGQRRARRVGGRNQRQRRERHRDRADRRGRGRGGGRGRRRLRLSCPGAVALGVGADRGRAQATLAKRCLSHSHTAATRGTSRSARCPTSHSVPSGSSSSARRSLGAQSTSASPGSPT